MFILLQKGKCIFPGYNWCGPGCSGPGDPINDVDACCKQHDECLDQGIPQCDCDREMLKCLRPKINLFTRKGRIVAIMYIYFTFPVLITCSFNK